MTKGVTGRDRVADHRRFVLYRHQDPTGVSGEGIVVEGVLFSDGSVAYRWLGDMPSTTIREPLPPNTTAMPEVEIVHGHGGHTEVVWLDQ